MSGSSRKGTAGSLEDLPHAESLGRLLTGTKKYAEAEPLLLSGYNGMKQREEQIPQRARPSLIDAAQRLAQLYEGTGQSRKLAQWKQKLSELDPNMQAGTR